MRVLLVEWDATRPLDFLLDVFNRVGPSYVQREAPAGYKHDENPCGGHLQAEGGFDTNAVVRELVLLPQDDRPQKEALLVIRDALFILDLQQQALHGVRSAPRSA